MQAGTKVEHKIDEDEDTGPVDGPTFVKKPQNLTALDGESAKIEFKVKCDTMPAIKFLKGKKEIKANNKVNVQTTPSV